MSNIEPLIRARGLTKVFDQTQALCDVSFDLFPGEVHGFIGPNGAGKTTAMRILAGVEQPDGGDVFLGENSIVRYPELCRSHMGFMPDYLDSYPGITVWEYLDFYARIYGIRPGPRQRRLHDVVAFVGLHAYAQQGVEKLSKGWKQRLSLARALIHDPKILILDEPAAGLDPRARVELRDLVLKLAEAGKVVFISSHILGELAEMCTAVTIIDQGRLCSTGAMDNLRQKVDGGNRVVVGVLNSDAEELRKLSLFLAQSVGIGDVVTISAGVKFTYEGEAALRADLLRRLLDEGFRITEYYSASSSLEEAFMAITNDRTQG